MGHLAKVLLRLIPAPGFDPLIFRNTFEGMWKVKCSRGHDWVDCTCGREVGAQVSGTRLIVGAVAVTLIGAALLIGLSAAGVIR